MNLSVQQDPLSSRTLGAPLHHYLPARLQQCQSRQEGKEGNVCVHAGVRVPLPSPSFARRPEGELSVQRSGFE